MTIQELETRINAQATKLSLLEQQVEKQKRINQKLMYAILLILTGGLGSFIFMSEPATTGEVILLVTILSGIVAMVSLITSKE